VVARRRPRSAPDRRRRSLGQNLLDDRAVVDRLLARLHLDDTEVVVDVGAGRGALTLPMAEAGARVLAIERDAVFVRHLQTEVEQRNLGGLVQIRRGDLREVPLPSRRFRVVASPPYGLTTTVLRRLLDDPDRGPTRADLLLQWDVARKRAQEPPTTLRSAAWAPWWRFELGEKVPRDAFRPIPKVDSGWLTIVRRDPPLLPTSLARGFGDVLAPAWEREHTHRGRSGNG
jgi:23S rRNA (adenine-N6)-dimethyltransferase